MYLELIDEMCEEFVRILMQVKRQDFLRQIEYLEECFPGEEIHEILFRFVKNSLGKIIELELQEDDVEDFIISEIGDFIEFRKNLCTSLTLKVSLKEDERVYRIFEMPSFHDFSTLGYLIVTMFDLSGEEPFYCTYNGMKYCSNDLIDEDGLNMELVPIPTLGLEVNEHMEFTYGLRDSIVFDIEVYDFYEYDDIFEMHQSSIIEGAGMIEHHNVVSFGEIDDEMETQHVMERFVEIAQKYESIFLNTDEEEEDYEEEDEDSYFEQPKNKLLS